MDAESYHQGYIDALTAMSQQLEIDKRQPAPLGFDVLIAGLAMLAERELDEQINAG